MTFTKLLRDKEIDDDGNCWWVFLKLCHCQIIWYLFAGFKAMILCSVHSIWFVKCFLLNYDLWKLQLESWNTNHESLYQTLKKNIESAQIINYMTTNFKALLLLLAAEWISNIFFVKHPDIKQYKQAFSWGSLNEYQSLKLIFTFHFSIAIILQWRETVFCSHPTWNSVIFQATCYLFPQISYHQ